MSRFHCPHCGREYDGGAALAGRTFTCAACKRSYRVPQATNGQETAWLEHIATQNKQTNALLASISSAVSWLLICAVALVILHVLSCLALLSELR